MDKNRKNKKKSNDILDLIRQHQEEKPLKQAKKKKQQNDFVKVAPSVFDEYPLDEVLESAYVAGIQVCFEYGPMEAEGYVMSNPTEMLRRTRAILRNEGFND